MAKADSAQLQRLEAVRHGLLRLHKALLDAQRRIYEQSHGRVGSTGQFLQLAISDPAFDWLHRFSELVVQIDEVGDGDEPLTTPAVAAFLDLAGRLVGSHPELESVITSDANAARIRDELLRLLAGATPNP